MTETTAHKIQIAADMLHDEMHRRGTFISPAECLALARRLYDLWEERRLPPDMPAGEVAQRLRARYQGQYKGDNWSNEDA